SICAFATVESCTAAVVVIGKNRGRHVCPEKASAFSGRQPHQGKSQNLVVWSARGKGIELLKPDDKAIRRMVSEYPGRNDSEHSGSLKIPIPGRRIH
ncbi:MAG: hypothetical protein H0Z25_07250, partial [Kosmotoga sp.]|uniref:hypothetical protein n=1 Tax=Kosmotoga sp. TaxID=1955248 RepID=UPI001D50773A